MRDALVERIRAGVPFLGICLGLQALFESSEEAPEARGLGTFRGTVEKFRGDARVPHMGWNSLERVRESRMLEGVGERPYVYFANSFYAPAIKEASALCEYGARFTAILEHDNIHAVQFHPEKSGAVGLKMMSNFACLVKRIIPCLDVTGGRVVKGVNFVNLRDAGDPVELAARYNDQGADELVFLDITASSDARDIWSMWWLGPRARFSFR